MLPISLELLFIFILILLNGVLAMAEIALVSARKTRLEQQASQGKNNARIAHKLASSPGKFLATVQIGITLVGILAGAFGGATLAQALDDVIKKIPFLAPQSQLISLLVVVAVITYLSLVFGELVPKRVALNNPERIALRLAPGMQFLSKLAAPLSKLLNISTDFVLRLVGSQLSAEQAVTEEDIKALIQQGARAGVVANIEKHMVSGVFRLGDRQADALLTPRTDIEWLDMDKPVDELLKLVLSSCHSVFPVARSSLDNIVGIISAKEFLANMIARPGADLEQKELQQPVFVPGSAPAFELLHAFRQCEHNMILIIDEFGGLAGLVTPQNIFDAIYGDTIQAEKYELDPSKIESWQLTGLTPVDQLMDMLPIRELPVEAGKHYKTLGGMITTRLGRIPQTGDQFTYDGWRFEVVDMDHRRVEMVQVTKTEA